MNFSKQWQNYSSHPLFPFSVSVSVIHLTSEFWQYQSWSVFQTSSSLSCCQFIQIMSGALCCNVQTSDTGLHSSSSLVISFPLPLNSSPNNGNTHWQQKGESMLETFLRIDYYLRFHLRTRMKNYSLCFWQGVQVHL